MNGSNERRKPGQRPFDGRSEKRSTTLVRVRLASPTDIRAPERTVTESISPHGTRIISERSWQPGEDVVVVPRGEFPHTGKVVYCEAKTGGNFCLGVEFRGRSVKWGDDSRT